MRVQLSLGSNLGDRQGHLRAALAALDEIEGVRLCAVSHAYETEPVGVRDQPAFLNLAAEVETALAPLELLDAAKTIERRLGRKPARRWGPRTVDIDLILWGQNVLNNVRLTLPHAEFRSRAFVLTPMAEIRPCAVDPLTGKTVFALANGAAFRAGVQKKTKLAP